MIYFKNRDLSVFYKDPSYFDKYTDKDVLKYAIGANMYMPGNKANLFEKFIDNDFKEVGAVTLCCEDAIKESEVELAETSILELLDSLHITSLDREDLAKEIPLIFIRVRSVEQFKSFSEKFNANQLKFIAGFVFPKFNSKNGAEYYEVLKSLSDKHKDVIYGMPILESEELIYKENRFKELELISKVLSKYNDMVLNIRVGGTDFSSRFGLRRSVYNTIYDVRVVSDCLIDILNFFLRMEYDYVISGPVWEYFSYNKDSIEIQGLIKELEMDIQNGFHGKTIIHPSQINCVNEKYVVTYEEYEDAMNILESDGGVFKGCDGNKMNEVKPHTNWAKKIVRRANIFGVLDKGASLEL